MIAQFILPRVPSERSQDAIFRRAQKEQLASARWEAKLKPLPTKCCEGAVVCCRRNCLINIPSQVLTSVREKFSSQPSQVLRKRVLKTWVDKSSPTSYSICEGLVPICWSAMSFLTGASRTLLQNTADTPKRRNSCAPNRPSRAGTNGQAGLYTKTALAESWMRIMVDLYCDVQPDEEFIHLPFGQRKDVYEMYRRDCRNGMAHLEGEENTENEPSVLPRTWARGKPLCRSKFYKVWATKLPNVKVRTYHRFAICSTCMDINDEISKATSDAQKMKWQLAKQQHLNDVAIDRAAYHYRIERSIQFKDSLSLIVDGAEMSRYSLPYSCVSDKESAEGWKIPTRLYGAILHGEFAAAYVFPAFFPGGTNVTIEVIHRVLNTYVNGDKSANIHPKKLPPVLFLQLDNTAKECKNRFLFTYLKSLIDSGVFKEIYLNFLPVGHTHCDGDQMYSRFSVHFKGHSAYDFVEFAAALMRAYDDCKIVEECTHFVNFSDTVKSLLRVAADTDGADHFNEFRSFKFYGEQRVMNGKMVTVGVMRCQLFYRTGASQRLWKDTQGRDANIPMWKDPNLVLDFKNFWKLPRLFMPYIIPALSDEAVQNYEKGLDSSTKRVEGNRSRDRAHQILTSLQNIIDKGKAEQSFKFDWKLRLYKDPPVMGPEDLTVPNEELALVEEKLMDKARKRLTQETCIRIEKIVDGLEVGDFVITLAPDDVLEPFYVAHVLRNDFKTQQLFIHWFHPTSRSRERGNRYHAFCFEEENVHKKSRGRQDGKQILKVRLDPRTQMIDYDVVQFGFNRLLPTGALPAEVQRQLRSLGLIKGTVKRN